MGNEWPGKNGIVQPTSRPDTHTLNQLSVDILESSIMFKMFKNPTALVFTLLGKSTYKKTLFLVTRVNTFN